jgi:hypothetical protein
MRTCQVAGCNRRPRPGWSRCDAHVEAWLDRLFAVPHLAWRFEDDDRARTAEIPENELRALWGDR